ENPAAVSACSPHQRTRRAGGGDGETLEPERALRAGSPPAVQWPPAPTAGTAPATPRPAHRRPAPQPLLPATDGTLPRADARLPDAGTVCRSGTPTARSLQPGGALQLAGYLRRVHRLPACQRTA